MFSYHSQADDLRTATARKAFDLNNDLNGDGVITSDDIMGNLYAFINQPGVTKEEKQEAIAKAHSAIVELMQKEAEAMWGKK